MRLVTKMLWLMLVALGVSGTQSSCPETLENVINVHFIPHTHDDVGWLKTVDQYYYGTNKASRIENVQSILDSVVEALRADKSRRFIFVEMAFFWRWWSEQLPVMREEVRTLVREGRLEFINGGWSMNDEAAAHYNAIIDQMTLGLRFLNDTFGPDSKPRVAWQIDPFGHSKEQANIFHAMGFEGLYFARADHADIDRRKRDKEMEMIWEGRPNGSRLFTGVLPHHYTPPEGFCFDILCSDDPIQSNTKLYGFNLHDKMRTFLAEARKDSGFYKTNHVPMTMGGDFQYMDASMWFKNMDLIIKYFSNKTDLNIVYSTPSCYMDAVRKNKDVRYPLKRDDFFPYAMNRNSGYWTGYFTSRPSLKRLIRFSNNVLQACKQLDALSHLGSDKVIVMKRALAVAQHHDAVTGTAQQHVTDDYLQRLSIGMGNCFEVMSEAYNKLGTGNQETSAVFCPLLNITECRFTSKATQDFYVTLYNPLSHTRNYTASFPGRSALNYDVESAGGVAVFPVPKEVLRIPGRTSHSFKESIVHFEALNIPPLSWKTYKVSVSKHKPATHPKQIHFHRNHSHMSILIHPKTQRITGIITPFGLFHLNIEMGYYLSSIHSGAYVFRPRYAKPVLFQLTHKPIVRRSGHITEILLEFSSWASVIVRVNPVKEFIELEWNVGPIPEEQGGVEVILKYRCADLKSNATFITDSNGRQWVKRVKNHRDTWDLDLSIDEVSRNYYPVTSYIGLEDEKIRMSVLTDRSQGGTSLSPGEIELMLHRRITHDDGFGVSEPLNEFAYGQGLVCRGKHYLVFEKAGSRKLSRNLGLHLYDNVITSFYDKKPLMNHRSVPLNPGILPKNIHILTLENVGNGILIRFEHFFDEKEDPQLSKTVSFDIKDVFQTDFLPIKSIREVILSGDKYLSSKMTDYNVKLAPMEIRSFFIFT